MIAGLTLPVLLPPVLVTDVDPSEAFSGITVELRNGQLTPLGHWRRRPGFVPSATIPESAAIRALIPEPPGLVVGSDGTLYRLDQTEEGLNSADQAVIDAMTAAALLPTTQLRLSQLILLSEATRLQEFIGTMTELTAAGNPPTVVEVSRFTKIIGKLQEAHAGVTQAIQNQGVDLGGIGELTTLSGIITRLTDFRTKLITALGEGTIIQINDLIILTARRLDILRVANSIADKLVAQIIHRISEYRRDHNQTLLLAIAGSRLDGTERPTWANHEGKLLVCAGSFPLAITLTHPVRSAALSAQLSGMRFVTVVDSFVIFAGADDVTFRWSAAGNSSSYPAANFNTIANAGEKLLMLKSLRRVLYLFTSKSIELWRNVGGLIVFARESIVAKGTTSGHSVVQANDSFYWLGDDRDFYRLDGLQPRVISTLIHPTVSALNHPEDVYGFDFRDEHCVRWFAPTDGRCFVYDYLNNFFSEDALWVQGGWQMLPIAAHMEWHGRTLIGDRFATGRIFEWSTAAPTDNQEPIRVVRTVLVRLSPDGALTRVNRARVRLKRGEPTGPLTGPAAVRAVFTPPPPPHILLRWRFDGAPWGPYHPIDLGGIGERAPFVDVFRLGAGREIAFEIVGTDSAGWLLTDVLLTTEPFGH